MIWPPVITDNLATRISAIILGSFIAMALAASLLMFWPRPGEAQAGLFQLPVPQEAAYIAEALESVPPAARPAVLRALNTSTAAVYLTHDFPPVPPGLKRSHGLEALFDRYSQVLNGRPFRVDLRRGLFPALFSFSAADGSASVRMSIRLTDDEVLVIDRRPPALIRSYIARAAVIAAVTGIVLLAALALAVRQTARPVNQLAFAARRFSLDDQTVDLPEHGPRELRDLASAFNDMQHRIRALVEERTRVLGAVAHDLRTYLTRLRLRADFIADPEQQRKAVRDVDEMAQLLDDILLFTEHATRRPADAVTIDLASETADFVALRADLGDAVELAGSVFDPPMIICCPPLAYRRMLSNLVENAIRYGGVARLTLSEVDDRIEVAIEDDGPGVPEADLDRILNPFERGEASRARATGGAGLGLAIVKGLAESAGGDLRLVNRPEGGLSATLRFERAPAP